MKCVITKTFYISYYSYLSKLKYIAQFTGMRRAYLNYSRNAYKFIY